MKKTLISSLVLASLVLPFGGQIARAQVSSDPATVSQVDELKSTLIALLTQLIAQLQTQMDQIIASQTFLVAQQASTSQAVSAIQTSLTPVLGSSDTPTPVAPLKILNLGIHKDGDGVFLVDLTTNRPIDISASKVETSPTLSDGGTFQPQEATFTDSQSSAIGANCTEQGLAQGGAPQREICGGSRVRFHVNFPIQGRFYIHLTVSDADGGTTKQLIESYVLN